MTATDADLSGERDLVFSRWRRLCMGRRTLSNLIAFHSRHKLQILSHDPRICRELGHLVARGKGVAVDELFPKYRALLTRAMYVPTTPGKHLNVLQHIAGHFKRGVTAEERRLLSEAIDAYRHMTVSLDKPLALIRGLSRKHDKRYLSMQTYLGNALGDEG